MRITKTEMKNTLKIGYDINTWVSDRSGWKSSTAQDVLIELAEQGQPFILLRNKKDEEITENWLSDYIITDKYRDYVFYTEKVNQNITSIKFKTPDDNVYLLCYGLYVSLQQKYKSSYYDGFEKVNFIVWEECIPNVPLVQNIKYIRSRCMTEINNVLSIGSTVARGRKIQYIWLGNDIKENILNPVTIGFNLLERLEINNPIVDNAVFNDKEYSFYFNYFDFDGAINHWLFNENLHITRTIEPDATTIKFDLIIKTNFKEYFLYNCGSYYHISDIDYIKSQKVTDSIKTEQDFFKKFNAERLYIQYPLRTALTILCTFQGVPARYIRLYFGDGWVKGDIKFTPPENNDTVKIIDIENIIKLPLSQIVNLPEYSEIYNINEIKKNNILTYSNIKVQMLIEELSNILLFV